ncbi:hypothetical protein [Ensifer aridi]|uniref:hypothetical protein n=1 Tax=Ensifer aridi TaxID=1708715 RepID=UPI000A102F63|nr:hypothetical protein [Ensifer aridi]
MHRNFTSDGEDGVVGAAASPSKVIPFRRGSASTSAPTAGDVTSSSPAPIALGDAVQAVVMKLANKRVRLQVMRLAPDEEEKGQPR